MGDDRGSKIFARVKSIFARVASAKIGFTSAKIVGSEGGTHVGFVIFYGSPCISIFEIPFFYGFLKIY